MSVGGTLHADDGVDSRTYTFDIPSQSADSALTEFAEQADLTLVFPDELVRGRTANALVGEYSLEDGAAILLEGTGLIPSFSNSIVLNITIDETSTSGEKAVNAAKRTGLIAIIAGALSGGVNAQESTGAGTEIQVSVVTGTVTDARTGANLKGAKVTIEDTGQWVSTDNLGQFRFVNVPKGSATLTVSFLGYTDVSETIVVSDDSQVLNIQAVSLFDEIVVLGTTSGRMQALNQERTASVTSTVLNADQLGTFNGTTIAEALRRAPGVALIPDPETGDGANVIVRGIQPDLNQVQLNGIRLLDGTGLDRAPDLSSFLTESIESVTISKSLLPSQDSNGAGALIEIETKSPLDRDRRFASVVAEYGERGNDFGDEFLVGGTLSGTFGANEDFGASISANYREREVTNLSYAITDLNFGQYLPLNAAGEPVERLNQIDPRVPFPFEPGVDEVYPVGVDATQGSVENSIFSVTGVLEKQFGAHTNLRLDATYTQREDSRYSATTGVQTQVAYDLAPVPELGGELRNSLVSEDIGRVNDGLPSDLPEAVNGFVSRNVNFQPEDKAENIILSFRGDTRFDAWDLNYGLGYSLSESESGQQFVYRFNPEGAGIPGRFPGFNDVLVDRSQLTSEAIANQTGDGRIVSIFAPLPTSDDLQFVLPLFNQSGFDFYNNIDNIRLAELTATNSRESEADALTANFSARRNYNHDVIRYLEAGFTYQDTEFFAPSDIGASAVGFGSFGIPDQDLDGSPDFSLSDIGLAFGPGLLTSVGATNDFLALSRGSVEQVSGSIQSLLNQGRLVQVTDRGANDTTSRTTQEETFSVYVQARADFGPVEIVGGLRVEHLELSSTFFSFPNVLLSDFTIPDLSEFQEFVTESVTQTDYLPRIAITYRRSDNLVFRGAYYTTVSQPQLEQLTARDTSSLFYRFFFQTSGPPATFQVVRGNPELEPATTHNFSTDVEYYTDDVGVLSASVFYKETENALQQNRILGDSGVLPDDFVFPAAFDQFPIPEGTEFSFFFPTNSGFENTIWGVELNAIQQFQFLPSPWDGFGMIANYTYTDSDSTRRFDVDEDIDPSGELFISGIPFDVSPEHQGTVGLTYSKYGIDGSLLYTAQSRRLAGFDRFSTSIFDEDFDTLDLQVVYTREFQGSNLSIFFRGNDLLRGDDDSFLESSRGGENGVPTYFTGATFLGGRSFEAGVRVQF